MTHVLLGATATMLAFVSYVPYFRDIFGGRTKPHAISWLVWGILTAIGAGAALVGGGGPGAWQLVLTAAICGVIFVLALNKGEKDIRPLDWACLCGAVLALALWVITDGPLLSVVLITVVDAVGFVPTFRKSFAKPYEETLSTYVMSTIKHSMSIFALTSVTAVTMIYPLSLVIMNGSFVLLLWIRRRQVEPPAVASGAPASVPAESAAATRL